MRGRVFESVGPYAVPSSATSITCSTYKLLLGGSRTLESIADRTSFERVYSREKNCFHKSYHVQYKLSFGGTRKRLEPTLVVGGTLSRVKRATDEYVGPGIQVRLSVRGQDI